MRHILCGAVLVSALALAGCEREDSSKPTVPPVPPPAAGMPGTEGAVPAVPGAIPPAVPGAVSAAAGEAQAKLDQVTQYIKENKLDLAEKALAELEKNKGSLPVTVADQLPRVRQMLSAAQNKGNLPAVPGL